MHLWLVISLAVALGALLVAGSVVLHARRAASRTASGDPPQLGRTRDARGTIVTLLDPMPLYTFGRHDLIDEQALRAIVQQLEPGVTRHRPLLLLGLVTIALLVLGTAAFFLQRGPTVWDNLVGTVTNPAIIACLAGGVIAPWMAARHERLTRLRAVMLAHRRCPHCGYGLTGVPPGADGRTTCPECGCVWELSDAACEDPGPAPARAPRLTLVILGLGLTALLAAAVAYFLAR